MATIWKFPIELRDEFMLEMPRDAELLFVAAQNDMGCLWARVVPGRQTELRKFKLRGTGHEVDTACDYVGSFMSRGGSLVFHLFEDRQGPGHRIEEARARKLETGGT